VAALTVERASFDIERLPPLWLACTTAIALLGELVLCARRGSILSEEKDEWERRVDEDAWSDVQVMNHLRNSVCHPASQSIVALCDHIERHEPDTRALALELRADWSYLGTRELSEYALRKSMP